ncbi:MAG: glycosyltransferase [Butyrivibrio sp.]|nr:glycosyltransferase [Butyrivibrio sp.]
MKISLCLLTWNEIAGCKHDIPQIDRSKFDEIYCIDGGSTDGTVEYLESQGIKVYQQSAKGLNIACKDGAAHCNCDAFVFYHPKGSIPVEDSLLYRKEKVTFIKYLMDGFLLVLYVMVAVLLYHFYAIKLDRFQIREINILNSIRLFAKSVLLGISQFFFISLP